LAFNTSITVATSRMTPVDQSMPYRSDAPKQPLRCELRRFPDQSETSKPRWLSSTQLDTQTLQRSRSAFPNLIPLTVQFAPPGDVGTTRSTITPTKALHSGLLFLTASAIADSRAARVIKVRPLGFSSPLFALIFVPRILGNPALNSPSMSVYFHSRPARGCEKSKTYFRLFRSSCASTDSLLTNDSTVPVANGFPGSRLAQSFLW
jgi:hypothetical protein